MNQAQNHGLQVYEQELSPEERQLMQVCALFQEPISKTNLLKTLRKIGPSPWSRIKKVGDLEPYIQSLQSKRLLDSDLMCMRFMQEIVARKAAGEEYFPDLVAYISQEWPAMLSRNRWLESSYSSLRLFRDLRLELLGHDFTKLQTTYEIMQDHFGDDLEHVVPLLSITTNPFDPEWMQTLPLNAQVMMLSDVLEFGVYTSKPHPEVVAYARSLSISASVPRYQRIRFFSALSKSMLLALDLDQAEKALANVEKQTQAKKLQAWHMFLQGRPDKAVDIFEQALQLLRKNHKSKTVYFSDECGLIFVFCLLKVQDRKAWNTLSSIIEDAQLKHNVGTLFLPGYVALQAVLLYREGQMDQVQKILAKADAQPFGTIAQLTVFLAKYWVGKEFSTREQKHLHNVLRKVHSQGMDWLVFELGALLQQTGKRLLSQTENKAVHNIRQKYGLTPMAEVLQMEEPWRQALLALQRIAGESKAQQTDSPEYRLAWLVQPQGDTYVHVQPKLQKKNAKGEWTKGRNVALNKLFHQAGQMDYLTDEDRRILSALQHHYSPYSGSWYAFDPIKVMPLLVGHPRLFLESAPDTPVEFVRGEPEVTVQKAGNGFVLAMSPDIEGYSFQLLQESPTRFKVLHLTDKHKQIASLLRSGEFSIPRSGYEELVRTVSSLSGLVTVHSDIVAQAEDASQVQADSRPYVIITPAGSGFRVEMTVRPLGLPGPSLQPGQGQSIIMAEVQGQRMQTARDLKEEERLAKEVENACPSLAGFEDRDWSWILPDPQACLHFLSEIKAMQDEGQVQVLWPEGEKLSVAKTVSLDHLHLALRGKQNWFEVQGQIDVDQETVLELKKLLQVSPNTRFIPLDETHYAALSRGLRRRLQEIGQLAEVHGNSVKIPAHGALILQELEQEVGDFSADQNWSRQTKAIKEAAAWNPSVPSTLKAELREYQIQGYQWLSRLAQMGFGACLADDMGLGKTLQALALIVERAPQGPTLVVAPTSVCSNWLAEARRFAPTLQPTLYAGKEREHILQQAGPFDLIVCSYALLNQDAEALAGLSWQSLALDEAQAIKNWNAKRTQAAMQLQAGFSLITTGTPLENNLNELWTLFRFINPGLLGPRKRFHERFAVPIQKEQDQEQKRVLKQIIRPFILRRLKSQVMEELPARTEVTLKVGMSEQEAALYEAMRRQALENLESTNAGQGQKHLQILAELTRLRQLCCDPRLVYPESEVTGSKLDLLQELVAELLSTGHKALIFSQFVKNLHLVQERMHSMGVEYRYLDGSTPSRVREQEISAFQSGQGDVFLISLKAGGLGINLTAADYVIHLDPWWNPALEDQAADRVHRIGQERPVTVYRLVTENTVEEKIVQLHAEKRDLANSLLEGSDVSHRVDAEELMQLLRHDAAR
ncbi:MAG: DEAD/DEAH box helicase [Desulfohalobiaceae bacterium]